MWDRPASAPPQKRAPPLTIRRAFKSTSTCMVAPSGGFAASSFTDLKTSLLRRYDIAEFLHSSTAASPFSTPDSVLHCRRTRFGYFRLALTAAMSTGATGVADEQAPSVRTGASHSHATRVRVLQDELMGLSPSAHPGRSNRVRIPRSSAGRFLRRDRPPTSS